MAKRKTAAHPVAAHGESKLLRWLKDRRITEVECLVPDFTGNARGKIIPAAKFSHDYGTRLPEGIFVTTVTGDASQRRVMYLPLMNGPVKEKHDGSPTPFYFRLKRLAGY